MKKIILGILVIIALLALIEIFGGVEESRVEEKIRVGVILPLTGPAASVTEDLQNTLLMYEEESEDIEFVIQDDKCSGKDAISAYNLLKNQGIRVYMVACSGSILALAPIVADDGNVIVTAYSGSIAIRETGDEVIRFNPDGLSIAEGILDTIKNSPDTTYALFHENQDYPESVSKKLFEEVGEQIVLHEQYKGDDTTFKTQILKLIESEADQVIYIPVSETASEIILKEMKELGLDKPLLGDVNLCDHEVRPEDFDMHGKCFTPVLSSSGYNNYLLQFESLYGREPGYPFYNAVTYDVLYILDRLLSDVSEVDDETIASLKSEILSGQDGVITSYEFLPNGEVIKGDYLKEVSF